MTPLALSLLALVLSCGPGGGPGGSGLESGSGGSGSDTGGGAGGDAGSSGDEGPADDTGDTGDTGDAPHPWGCEDGRDDPASPLPETWTNGLGATYLVVELPSDHHESLYVMVTFPAEGHAAYTDGAPVVVAVPPSMDRPARFDESPQGYLRPEHGVVEVLPILPGWSVQGQETTGPADFGGEGSARAIAVAVRFAAGQLETVEGWRLSQLVASPVCVGRVALLANSSGGLPAALALETEAAELGALLVGFTGYENPSLPVFALLDAGGTWADPAPEVDHDGSGVPWDDGRNPTLGEGGDGGCGLSGCDLGWSALRYEADLVPAEVFPGAPAASTEPGLFYLDGDGDGVLGLDAEGGLDLDGSGLLEDDEDFAFLPHLDTTAAVAGTGPAVHTFTPQLVAAAVELGLFDASGWPETVRSPEDTVAFWAERTQADRVAATAPLLPEDLGVVQVYTEVPHGTAVASRPDIRVTHQAWLDAGVPARANASPALLRCASRVAEAVSWAGGPGAGEPLEAETAQDGAIPEAVPVSDVRAAGVLQLFADAWGPPEHCHGEG